MLLHYTFSRRIIIGIEKLRIFKGNIYIYFFFLIVIFTRKIQIHKSSKIFSGRSVKRFLTDIDLDQSLTKFRERFNFLDTKTTLRNFKVPWRILRQRFFFLKKEITITRWCLSTRVKPLTDSRIYSRATCENELPRV